LFEYKKIFYLFSKGMRSSADLYIYIDMEKALKGLIKNFNLIYFNKIFHFFSLLDGLKFFISTNNVILSPGNEDGYIPTRYFRSVQNRKGEEVQLPIDSLKTTT